MTLQHSREISHVASCRALTCGCPLNNKPVEPLTEKPWHAFEDVNLRSLYVDLYKLDGSGDQVVEAECLYLYRF